MDNERRGVSDKAIIWLLVGACALAMAVAIPLISRRSEDVRSKPAVAMAATTSTTQTATKPSVKPAARPRIIPSTGKGTITGSAWISRKTGASDILRGLEVSVIEKFAPKANVKRAVWYELAEHERLVSALERGDFTRVTEAGKIASEKKLIARAKEMLDDSAEVVEVGEVYRLVVSMRANGLPPLDGSFGAPTIARANTDINGSYAIRDIPDGTYYLQARLITEWSAIEWLVPIQCNGKTTKIDLFNDTAIVIANFPR